MSVTLITGSASRITLALARRLIDADGKVVLGDLNESVRAEVEDVIGESGTYATGDVADDAYLDELIGIAVDRYGGVTGAVHAAAIFADDLYDTTREDWHRALDINVVAAAILTQKVIPVMEAGGGGSIVYVASISGFRAQPRRMVYSVTKAALHMLAKTGGNQLARRGIRVNTVSPGWTWSRNIEVRYGDRQYADTVAAEFQPMGRMADPDEIAAAIQWLLSDEASFVTATDLAVDGGYDAASPEAMGQPFEKYPTVTSVDAGMMADEPQQEPDGLD